MMKKMILTCALCLGAFIAQAQVPVTPVGKPGGPANAADTSRKKPVIVNPGGAVVTPPDVMPVPMPTIVIPDSSSKNTVVAPNAAIKSKPLKKACCQKHGSTPCEAKGTATKPKQ